MMRKISNRIAALALLALAANTALRLHSWPGAETTTDRGEYHEPEWRRKLKHQRHDHGTDSYYDKTWRDIERDHEPGTTVFEAMLRNRIARQERALLDELARYHRSQSALDRTWKGLVKHGITPGTPPFDRLLEHKEARREAARGNETDEEGRKLGWEWDEAKEAETPEIGEAARRSLGVRGENRRKRIRNRNLKDSNLKVEGVAYQGDHGVDGVEAMTESVEKIEEMLELNGEDYQPLSICDRLADVGSTEDFAALQKYAQCAEITKEKPVLLLTGMMSFGRMGNNLIEFLHALQEARDEDMQLGIMYKSWAMKLVLQMWMALQKARDQDMQLGIMYKSWAMKLVLQMWMAIESDDWQAEFEQAFCVKIFMHEQELEGWEVIHQDTKELFYYMSELPLEDYVASQEYNIRTLFHNYNTGEGKDLSGSQVEDMCSGINALFGEERGSAMYSVIHSRSLEGEPGFRMLGTLARRSGCDPVAALEMKPDYVKAILEPLDMMRYPIVFITDGQNSAVLDRLLADPDIGPMIRIVPKEACWVGGDLTLAIMSNAFIGNPASTFTGFIAKSRLALGFGHNYLFRAKDKNGEWKEVCGDHCVFDKKILKVKA
eukprot:CAMPEP_0172573088 /NCGR_PEP_ID=MMETSP1067-20121228/136011_1 /TAXON_ID=265564 ORGANISM="Thalassiosira punctigera, Strain Tpunct2005C2" /NCGR_SAMPLE_ID=MMETSP1067 /ASSEMBLY_ACC=CAM_ASM_000444 /LENGTH=605 /DNA_ID=CAMNT_0013365685 /DNA_START=46 /DNA_END=1863 /DNA_ORIENTATION=-